MNKFGFEFKTLRRSTVALLLSLVASSARAELKVSSDFENGSCALDGVDQATGTIRFRPAGDAHRGWPCWWSFRVDGITPGQTVTLAIAPSQQPLPHEWGTGPDGKPLSASWSRPDRAAYSIDGGKTWRQTEKGIDADGRRYWKQKIDTPTALFAWGPVFSVGDAYQIVERLDAEHASAESFDLAKTREGRPVKGLIVREGDLPDAQRRGVWIQARQHAWESGGSWVGVGFIEWLLSDDPRAKTLRNTAVVYYVPVMDVDNVATGNGGKNTPPQDHNRDWSAKPSYPEVAAAQRIIAAWDKSGTFDVFVDLHNPGSSEPRPYFFTSPDELLSPTRRRYLENFVKAGRTEITGPLKLEEKTKPSGAAYSFKWREISKNWVTRNTRDHVVAVTLETAWNTPNSTQEGYRTVGRQLGLAIERHLRTMER
jgi:hypothetical protein